jgi:hypothetical protein
MEEEGEKLEITDYVEAASASSDRGRFVMIVMITASVLAFAAFWNARQGSWVNERLHVARVGAVGCEKQWDEDTRRKLPLDDQEVYDRSRNFYDVRHFHDCKQLDQVVKGLEDVQTQNVNFIKVPFFGIQFDENDLGLLAGFTFFVVLLWFRYSLVRELNNLNLTFAVAKTHSQQAVNLSYDLLAMRQVLTQPPMRTSAGRNRATAGRLSAWVPKLLYLMPLGMQMAISVDDAFTYKFGNSISPFNTTVLYSMDGCFLLLIGLLTFLCFALSNEIDSSWGSAANMTTPISTSP